MKIRLSAFNEKMWSAPFDVPDNTSPDFYMAMPMDVLAYNADKNVFAPTTPKMKRGHFQRTNMSWMTRDLGIDEDGYTYEYRLTDIS